MRRKVNIPFIEFDSKVPVIKLRLGDEELHALVDTGSESTLMDEKLKENKKIKIKDLEHDMSFVGLNGQTENKRIFVLSGKFFHEDAEIKIGGISADLSGISAHLKKNYGTDIQISALLGCDFLDCYRAVVDFDNHELVLYEK